MEARPKSDEAERKRRVFGLARSPRLWFQWGKALYRERRFSTIHRQRGSPAIHWQCGSATRQRGAAVHQQRWSAGFFWRRCGRASFNFPILRSSILTFGKQPFFLREQRVQRWKRK
jgi:hypothetical protein